MGWSQRRMGKALDLDRTYLSQLENARVEVNDYYVERVNILNRARKAGVEYPGGEIPADVQRDEEILKDEGSGDRTSTGSSKSEGERDFVFSHGQISALNRLVRKMSEDEVIQEMCEVLRDKKMESRERFATVRFYLGEMERREKDMKGGN